MDWKIDYSPLPIFIRVVTGGTATAEDNKAMWDEILASEHWAPGTSVLLENAAARPTGTDGYHINQEMTRYFAERVDEIGNGCLAIMQADRDIYNYVSQFQYAIRMRGSSVIIRSFSDAPTASQWLETVHGETEKNFR